MRYGSVCSGIEAATVAWHHLGWTPAWFSEIEKFPSAVLAHHYPDVPNLGDMTKLENHAGRTRIDLLVGGTPCQSFSVAGLRKGMADARGNLALVFILLLRRARARWVLWENVPGVLSSGNDFGCFLGGLVGRELARPEEGWGGAGIIEPSGPDDYGIAWRVLDAQHFGVPQRRRRVFVVGYLGDWRPAAAVLFERDGLPWDPAASGEEGEGASAGPRGGAEVGSDVANTLTRRYDSSPDGSGRGTPIVIDRAAFNAGENAQFDAQIKEEERTPPLVARGPSAVYWNGEKVAHTLTKNNAGGNQRMPDKDNFNGVIAFSSKDDGGDAGDKAPTLRAGAHDESHANGGSPPAVAYGIRTESSGANGTPFSKEIAKTLDTGSPPAVVYENHAQDSRVKECEVSPQINAKAGTGGGNLPLTLTPKAFTQNSRSEVRMIGGDGEIVGAVTAEPGAQCQNYIAGSAVRRLTPRECERLQGFPDDYTLIPTRPVPAKGQAQARLQAEKGDERFRDIGGVMYVVAADGPRYKALGNSMCAGYDDAHPGVMRWLGKRIAAVDEIIQGAK